MKVDAQKLIVYLPDTRGTTISRFGSGNLKVGLNVFTYSRLPGIPDRTALGLRHLDGHDGRPVDPAWRGTCPGATEECQAVCYASRPVAEIGPVASMWLKNSTTENVPTELPPGCTLLRLHISGDFTTDRYIDGWTDLLSRRPDVATWAYTRSWRVPSLLPALERLRALPHVQLFASMDKSTEELPPAGWRRAWIDGDERAGVPYGLRPHGENYEHHHATTHDGANSYLCPEQTKRQPNCETCGYCQHGRRGDVTFLMH